MRNRFMRIVTVTTVGLFAAQDALACTRVLWSAPDGQVFVGRTQDWTETPATPSGSFRAAHSARARWPRTPINGYRSTAALS